LLGISKAIIFSQGLLFSDIYEGKSEKKHLLLMFILSSYLLKT